MNSEVQSKIEDLWKKRRYGKVDAVSLVYEVCANENLRKIKVISGGKELPVEFYSIKALLDGQPKIREMLKLGDARAKTLSSVFKVQDSIIEDNDATLIVRPKVQFETTFYQYQNNAGFVCVFVLRPSGDIFYQRLSVPALLSYVLANQVGFLIVPGAIDGVYTTPDKQIEFSLVGESLQILNDFSKQ